jgi:hypothetical protein
MNLKMLRLLFTVSSVFLSFSLLTAQQDWVKSFGGALLDQGTGLALDNSGNVYTTGYFEGTISLPQGNSSVSMSSVGSRDFYMAKYDQLGDLIWVKTIGGGGQEHTRRIRVDAVGNVYVAGDFNSLVNFDPGVGFNLQNVAGASDVFVAKYDPQGNFLWVKKIGGVGIDACRDLVLDGQGNIYVAGIFEGTADFDPNGGVMNVTSGGAFDSFILKLNAAGNFLWVKTLQGSSNNFINEMKLDYSGNINAVGYFQGTADFDPNAGVHSLTTIGDRSAFWVKLNANGQFIAAQMIGGSGFEVAKSLAVDAQNNVTILGEFRGVIDFDPSSVSYFVTSSGLRDIFIAKYTAQGSLVWADKIGGIGDEQANSIVAGQNGDVFAAGAFNQSMMLSDKNAHTSLGGADIILARYSSTGELLFSTTCGGSNGDEAVAILLDGDDNLYSTGWFQGSSHFGATTLNSVGDRDVYLAKTKMEESSSTHGTTWAAAQMTVSPNPSDGAFRLSFDDLPTTDFALTVTDLMGRRIFSERFFNTDTHFQTQIQLNAPAAGLYLLSIETAERIFTKKIIIR